MHCLTTHGGLRKRRSGVFAGIITSQLSHHAFCFQPLAGQWEAHTVLDPSPSSRSIL
jgi:hypothetical protein